MISTKKQDLLPFFLFFTSFSIYLFSITPSVYWRDGAEFQTVGFSLGIAHPSGFPLFAIVSKLFTFLPFGSIAFKTTLLSAFFGGMLPVFVYFILSLILKQLSSEKHLSIPIRFISLIAALHFTFSNALWENSNVPEVYSFINVFTGLFILIFIYFLKNKYHSSAFKYFLILSFLFGLSLGAHSVEILYFPFLPILAIFLWSKWSPLFLVKYSSLAFFFFLLGFSVYLYLPVRASQQPYFNWGNPETFEQFMVHVTDRKDAAVHLEIPKDPNLIQSQLENYGQFFPDNFSYFGLGLGLAGIVFLFRNEKKYFMILATFFLPPFLFFIRFWGDSSNYLSGFFIFTIFIGIGMWSGYLLLSKLVQQGKLSEKTLLISGCIVCLSLVVLGLDHYGKNDRSDYWTPKKVFRNVLLGLDTNAIVFTRASHFSFSYLQEVANLRPDVTHLSAIEILSKKFFFKVSQSRFPLIAIPETEPEKLGSAFLSENISNHPIYWESDPQFNHLVSPYFSLDGLFFRLLKSPPLITDERMNAYHNHLKAYFDPDELSDNQEERRFYSASFANMGSYFLERNRLETALQHLKIANELNPENVDIINLLGIVHGQSGNFITAESYFTKALKRIPDHLALQRNLGLLYLSSQQYKNAELALNRALELKPDDPESNYQMGHLHRLLGDHLQARHYFKKALQEDPKHEDAKKELDALRLSLGVTNGPES